MDRTADFVENKLDELLMELGIQHRFQGQRHIVATLVQLIQGHVAQLRVALALLARRIPQPRVRDEDQAISSTTASELRCLLHALLLQLRPSLPSWSQDEPIDFDAVIPECDPASQLAINITQFLENGLFDFRDDITEAGSIPTDHGEAEAAEVPATTHEEDDQMLPPHAPRGPRHSSAAMSSSANLLLPTRALQPVHPASGQGLPPSDQHGDRVHTASHNVRDARSGQTTPTSTVDPPLPAQVPQQEQQAVLRPHLSAIPHGNRADETRVEDSTSSREPLRGRISTVRRLSTTAPANDTVEVRVSEFQCDVPREGPTTEIQSPSSPQQTKRRSSTPTSTKRTRTRTTTSTTLPGQTKLKFGDT